MLTTERQLTGLSTLRLDIDRELKKPEDVGIGTQYYLESYGALIILDRFLDIKDDSVDPKSNDFPAYFENAMLKSLRENPMYFRDDKSGQFNPFSTSYLYSFVLSHKDSLVELLREPNHEALVGMINTDAILRGQEAKKLHIKDLCESLKKERLTTFYGINDLLKNLLLGRGFNTVGRQRFSNDKTEVEYVAPAPSWLKIPAIISYKIDIMKNDLLIKIYKSLQGDGEARKDVAV